MPFRARWTLVVAAVGVLALLASDVWAPRAVPQATQRPSAVDDRLVTLDSPLGQQLLFASEARAGFLPLVAQFETQKSQKFCGAASLTMLLNALALPAPPVDGRSATRVFTQDDVLNARTDGITTASTVARAGMSLRQLTAILRAYGIHAVVRRASRSSAAQFRKIASAWLRRPGHHVLVNYSRAALGQDGIGHISPLGAYHAASDRFLVLDVARYKSPPVWVRTSDLFAAMAARIGDTRNSRGFVLVRAPSHALVAAR